MVLVLELELELELVLVLVLRGRMLWCHFEPWRLRLQPLHLSSLHGQCPLMRRGV
jgi:hypothetical protein